jgi:transcriptional regulator with GAF, ATPase, and Fis domain
VGTTTFEHSAQKVSAETTVRGLLATTCEELVELLGATACAVSRVVGDLLVGLDEHTLSGRPLEYGHEYLIPDYPLTKEVIESGQPRQVSRLDPAADPTEAELLEKLGFESLLMVCLPTSKSCWGLVEVYGEADGFDEESADVAVRFARRTGELLERLEVPDTR